MLTPEPAEFLYQYSFRLSQDCPEACEMDLRWSGGVYCGTGSGRVGRERLRCGVGEKENDVCLSTSGDATYRTYIC